MPIDLDKQFKEERQPLIEYEVVQDESKDPFVPAKETKMNKETAKVYIEL